MQQTPNEDSFVEVTVEEAGASSKPEASKTTMVPDTKAHALPNDKEIHLAVSFNMVLVSSSQQVLQIFFGRHHELKR